MSWVQWQGEVWPATDHEAELHLHLWPRDAACPRQSWSWSLHHYPKEVEENGARARRRWICPDLLGLNVHEEDWRRLAHREIRADAAWHDLHETTNEHGNLNVSQVSLLLADLNPPDPPPGHSAHQTWVGHDFILRLGAREGFIIPAELDAWVFPKKEYYRLQPETAAEVARFGEGPPNLRVMARTRFNRCSVNVERCADPVPRAREYLRQAVGLDLTDADAEVSWDSYRKNPDGASEPRPGWTSTVEFSWPAKPAPAVGTA